MEGTYERITAIAQAKKEFESDNEDPSEGEASFKSELAKTFSGAIFRLD